MESGLQNIQILKKKTGNDFRLFAYPLNLYINSIYELAHYNIGSYVNIWFPISEAATGGVL